MAVKPTHKVCCPKTAFQVNTRNVEVSILEGAGGEDHRVVVFAQILQRQVRADVHIGKQTNVATSQHIRERDNDLLNARVVGCDAVADQAEGGGKPLDDVNRHIDVR